jgi:hypothetical protein
MYECSGSEIFSCTVHVKQSMVYYLGMDANAIKLGNTMSGHVTRFSFISLYPFTSNTSLLFSLLPVTNTCLPIITLEMISKRITSNIMDE